MGGAGDDVLAAGGCSGRISAWHGLVARPSPPQSLPPTLPHSSSPSFAQLLASPDLPFVLKQHIVSKKALKARG